MAPATMNSSSRSPTRPPPSPLSPTPAQSVQGTLGPIFHTYADIVRNRLIGGLATDEDGTYSIPSKSINVSPATSLAAGTLTVTGTTFSDVLTFSINSTTANLEP